MIWTYVYKIKDGNYNTTNLLYTPLKSKEGDVICMKWTFDEYQKSNRKLDQGLIDFYFYKEIKYLKLFENKPWTPQIFHVDLDNKQIFLEWNNESLNAIINDNDRNLDIECPNWKDQILDILKDIDGEGYYKLALYPHCFFLNKQGVIKTIDFYSCVEKSQQYVDRKDIEEIIGKSSLERFDYATESGKINLKKLLKITMLSHLEKTWIKDNPFPEFYRNLFND